MLEQERPQTLSCTASSPQAVCAGANNLMIQVFTVTENGKPALLSRNGYISVLRSYFNDWGPFTFSRITAAKSGVSMEFTGKDDTRSLSLGFIAGRNETWQFVSPSINNQ